MELQGGNTSFIHKSMQFRSLLTSEGLAIVLACFRSKCVFVYLPSYYVTKGNK